MPVRKSASCCLAIVSVLVAVGLCLVGCDSQTAVPEAHRGDALLLDAAVSIDLDGDDTREIVVVESPGGRLTITDGTTVYKSREKWQIAAAYLADSNADSRPEIVALVDAADGRHLGLFGYAPDGHKYRELLVTSVLQPRPIALRVLNSGETAAEGAGDLLIITEDGGGNPLETTYRWNGFGFTALEARGVPR